MEALARRIAPLRDQKVGVRARIEGVVRELEGLQGGREMRRNSAILGFKPSLGV